MKIVSDFNPKDKEIIYAFYKKDVLFLDKKLDVKFNNEIKIDINSLQYSNGHTHFNKLGDNNFIFGISDSCYIIDFDKAAIMDVIQIPTYSSFYSPDQRIVILDNNYLEIYYDASDSGNIVKVNISDKKSNYIYKNNIPLNEVVKLVYQPTFNI